VLVGDDLLGQVLAGRYRVVSPLGEGAMGQVWRARQLQLDRDVALKVLHTNAPVQARARRRLHREARLVARISHPNVVQVFDYGETEGGAPYLVMELVEGVVATGRMASAQTVSEVLAAVHGILCALEAAHDKGVLHRDLKPANMILRDGEPASLVLLDFGIAAILNEETATDHGDGDGGSARLTRDGAVVGTPLYMSPEQARGLLATERSDLYAVGVILHEWLSGQPPFVGTAEQVMRAHVFDRPPALVPRPGFDVPAVVLDIIRRSLAKVPGDRFHSASEMRHALEAAAEGAPDPPAWRASLDEPDLRPRPSGTLLLSRAVSGPTDVADPLGSLRRAPFTGRARELAWLDDRLSLGLSGRGAILLVEGDEGVGKSRLVEEALQSIDITTQPLLGRAALTPAGGSPMHLLRAALSDTVGARELDEDELVRRLGAAMGADAAPFAQWLRGASPPSFDGSGWVDTDLVHRALRALSPRRPLLLVLDDAQWADPATSAFLVQEAGALRHDPHPVVVVICRQRPSTDDPLADLARYEGTSVHRLSLDRLSATETESLLRGMAPLSGASAAAVASRAHGSPLFAVQLLRSLQDRSLLRAGDDGLELEEDLESSVLPVSLEQILTARLDRARSEVGESADPLLHAAAVLGEEFDVGTLEGVLAAVGADLGGAELDDGLDSLVESRVFVEPTGVGLDRLAWEHPLLRASVLERLRRSRRQRRLCRAAADALVAAGSSTARPVVELYLLAGDRAAAAPLASAAGEEALSAGEFAEAQRLFEVGVADPASAVRAWWGLGNARNDLGQRARAEEAFQSSLDASTTPSDRGRALFAIGRCRYNSGQHVSAIEALREADSLLRGADGPDAAVGRSLVARTWAAAASAVPGESMPDVDLDDLLADAQEPAHRLEAHKTVGYLRLRRGDLPGSIEAFRTALNEARQLGHRPGLADVLCDLGRACRLVGDAAGAREYLEEALGIARRAGQHRTEAEAHNELGELGRTTGALDSASEHYAAATSIWEALDSPSALLATLNQSLVAVASERFDDARSLLIALRKAHGDLPDWAQVPFLLTTALAASGGGQESAAREALSRAVQNLPSSPLDSESRSVLEQLRRLGVSRSQQGLIEDIDGTIRRLESPVPTVG
jgi:serine/threonine protein kinase/tetratricopeptide (TPR) repeat protein